MSTAFTLSHKALTTSGIALFLTGLTLLLGPVGKANWWMALPLCLGLAAIAYADWQEMGASSISALKTKFLIAGCVALFVLVLAYFVQGLLDEPFSTVIFFFCLLVSGVAVLAAAGYIAMALHARWKERNR